MVQSGNYLCSRSLSLAGKDIIRLTIGEADVAMSFEILSWQRAANKIAFFIYCSKPSTVKYISGNAGSFNRFLQTALIDCAIVEPMGLESFILNNEVRYARNDGWGYGSE